MFEWLDNGYKLISTVQPTSPHDKQIYHNHKWSFWGKKEKKNRKLILSSNCTKNPWGQSEVQLPYQFCEIPSCQRCWISIYYNLHMLLSGKINIKLKAVNPKYIFLGCIMFTDSIIFDSHWLSRGKPWYQSKWCTDNGTSFSAPVVWQSFLVHRQLRDKMTTHLLLRR